MKMPNTASMLIYLLLFSGCKKEFDMPPLRTPADGGTITIAQLKKRLEAPVDHYRFNAGDTNLYCIVTSDETSGNFFRQVHVRDEEGGAIQLRLVSDGGLFTGDRVRINLNNLYLVIANNMIYLDSVDVEKNVVKMSSGNEVLPKVTTLSSILAGAGAPLDAASLQSQLVELNGVEFDAIARGSTFADAVSKVSSEYLLRDCMGKSVSVRTSGRCNFASKVIPGGNGKLVAVVSQYDSEMQLTIRNFAEIKMQGSACTSVPTGTVVNSATFALAAPVTTINESFNTVLQNASFEDAGWINYNQTGNSRWKGNIKNGTYKSLKATSYGTAENNVMWLISPPVVYHNALKLTFKTAMEFYSNGHTDPLVAYISTDYNGRNFATANWTKLTSAVYANAADVNYTGPLGLKSSGEISLKTIPVLQSYTGNFFIGFRYSGDQAHTSNFYLDDIVVN